MSKEQIHQAYQLWQELVAAEKSEDVVNCYAKNAILLPTVSNTVCNTPELIKDYFDLFLAKKPRCKEIENHIRVFDTVATNSGVYRFTLNEDVVVDARFTFVYEQINGEWKIIEHHSSKMPE